MNNANVTIAKLLIMKIVVFHARRDLSAGRFLTDFGVLNEGRAVLGAREKTGISLLKYLCVFLWVKLILLQLKINFKLL